MKINDLKGSGVYIKCNNAYEHLELMKCLDKLSLSYVGFIGENTGTALQEHFSTFSKDVCYTISGGGLIYWSRLGANTHNTIISCSMLDELRGIIPKVQQTYSTEYLSRKAKEDMLHSAPSDSLRQLLNKLQAK